MSNKNGILKDALVLFSITLIAGLLLGMVYEVTKDPIEKQQIAVNLAAHKAVFPEAADFGYSDTITTAVKNSEDMLASSGEDFGNVMITDVLEARDASGAKIGHIVTSTTKDGYAGDIVVSLGVDLNGTTTGVEILQINETANLGMRATEQEFRDQYKGKSVTSFSVVKSKSADNEIDSISGATVTSKAVTNAVNSALYFINQSGLGVQ